MNRYFIEIAGFLTAMAVVAALCGFGFGIVESIVLAFVGGMAAKVAIRG